MTPEFESRLSPFRLSSFWDIYIPFTIAAVPAGIFALMGFVTEGLDKPRANLSPWLVAATIALQTLGMIAMAFVILMRLDLGRQQLSLRTNGHPPVWRKLFLVLSIICILLFDILTNIAAAFAGAGPLLILALPAFIAYLLFIRVAFAGL